MHESAPIPQRKLPEAYNTIGLGAIASLYGLPPLHFIDVPKNGIITENAILEDKSGKRYFAKLYQKSEAQTLISTYHAAELVAQASPVPISLPHKISEGVFTITYNDRPLALFDFVAHSEISSIDKEAELKLAASMGKNLALIHAVSIPPKDNMLRPIERWSPNQNERRKMILTKIIDTIKRKPEQEHTAFDTLALQTATEKLSLISNLRSVSAEENSLAICHGDFHAQNLLHNENMELVAICDWDNAGISNRYVDLLNTFITLVIGSRYDTFQKTRKIVGNTLIKSYVETTGTSIDIDQVENAFHIHMSERIGTTWPMNQHYFQNNSNQDGALDRVSKRSKALAMHYDEIWSFVRSCFEAAEK